MDPQLTEWLNLLARWIHVIAGIMWVGNSMLFNWLDRNLEAPPRPGRDSVGHIWLLHSGGFYFVEKTHLKSAELPPFVHWFKWQSYTTWISGICLVILVYYMSGASYLIDPAVWNVSPATAVGVSLAFLAGGWLVYETIFRTPLGRARLSPLLGLALITTTVYWLCHLFSGRGAYLQAGAMLGTLMAGNVFFHIIPSQKELYSSIRAGEGAQLALADRAKQRSIHNNYFTFPVIFAMISNHFGSLYGHPLNWLILLIIFLTGALIRHFMNIRFGFAAWRLAIGGTVAAAAAALFLIVGPVFATKPPPSATGGPPVSFAEARAVINRRCIACHSAYPTDPLAAATGGVHYDTPEQIKAKADRIKLRAVVMQTMPLGNKTGMTPEERALLGRWLDQGATLK